MTPLINFRVFPFAQFSHYLIFLTRGPVNLEFPVEVVTIWSQTANVGVEAVVVPRPKQLLLLVLFRLHTGRLYLHLLFDYGLIGRFNADTPHVGTL